MPYRTGDARRPTSETVPLRSKPVNLFCSSQIARGKETPRAACLKTPGCRAGQWRRSPQTPSSKTIRHGVRAERARQPDRPRERRGRESRGRIAKTRRFATVSIQTPAEQRIRPHRHGRNSLPQRAQRNLGNAHPRRLPQPLRPPNSVVLRNASPSRTRTCTLVVNTHTTAPGRSAAPSIPARSGAPASSATPTLYLTMPSPARSRSTQGKPLRAGSEAGKVPDHFVRQPVRRFEK
jgi:hypothetical protein